jgi:transcriptional regulator of acetoin/glycerol metabolism
VKSPFLGFGSEQALRRAAGALPQPAFTTDAAGRVTSWNDAAQHLTGWTIEEAGQLPPTMASAGASGLDALRTRDGRLLSVVRSATPFRDAAGAVAGTLAAWAPIRTASASALPCDAPSRSREQRPLTDALAAADVTVLIRSEPGPERDGIVRALHDASRRGSRPLVTVACRSLGAGPIRFASRRDGSLVLDEVGDLSANAQLALLGFLESHGPHTPGAVTDDVRLLCTTRIDLAPLVDACSFRADLHLRLSLFTVRARAEQLAGAPPPRPSDEREALAEALLKCGGSRTLAARELGISRVTLWKRMKRYGVYDIEVG